MKSEPIIQVEQISKAFGEHAALRDISLELEEGEIFGLIGPDGAGKTTLFRILATLLFPDSGQARVSGFDVVKDFRRIRKITGYMPGRFSLYGDLSVEENLRFYATIYGTTIEKNYHLIKEIYSHIEPFRKRKARDLSGGMKQKLALSCALIHHPQVLLLDEPTTGVDAVSRSEFWEMLKTLNAWKISILVSTPYMDEADQCNRVALMQEGNILSVDTPGNITAQYVPVLYKVSSADTYRLLKALRTLPGVHSVYPFGDAVHLSFMERVSEDKVRTFLRDAGHDQVAIAEMSPGIEDCFMELMQGNRE